MGIGAVIVPVVAEEEVGIIGGLRITSLPVVQRVALAVIKARGGK